MDLIGRHSLMFLVVSEMARVVWNTTLIFVVSVLMTTLMLVGVAASSLGCVEFHDAMCDAMVELDEWYEGMRW